MLPVGIVEKVEKEWKRITNHTAAGPPAKIPRKNTDLTKGSDFKVEGNCVKDQAMLPNTPDKI